MLLGIPAGLGGVVPLVQQQPVVLAVGLVAPDEDEAALQLLAVEVEVQVALFEGLGRVGVTGRPPGPPVPHDHVAFAVALGDHALEVVVRQGVVLHLDGQAAGLGVERRTLGDGPAEEDAVVLQSKVVMEPSGPVALDNEAMSSIVNRTWTPPLPTGRLRRFREVALGLVLDQLLRARRRRHAAPLPSPGGG
jgi:hypothetical protein